MEEVMHAVQTAEAQLLHEASAVRCNSEAE